MVTTAKGRSSEIQTNLGTVHQQRLERKSSAAQWEFEVTKKNYVGQSDKTPTLWLFNIAMENEPFIDDVPIKMVIFHGYVQ